MTDEEEREANVSGAPVGEVRVRVVTREEAADWLDVVAPEMAAAVRAHVSTPTAARVVFAYTGTVQIETITVAGDPSQDPS